MHKAHVAKRFAQAWQSWLEPHYRVLIAHEEEICLSFASPLEVLRHLKNTGVNSVTQKQWTKSNLATFCKAYSRKFSYLDGVHLTYHPLYCVAQKK